jgi:hypothetical protein
MNVSSIISQGKNLFSTQEITSFSIYEIDALTATTIDEQDSFIAVSFDAVYAYGYRRDSEIPYQPLEDGNYSTDSVLSEPFILRATGCITQAYSDDTIVDEFDSIGEITSDLDEYQNNLIQLIIFKGSPFFQAYYPMHLKSVSYEVSPDRTTLYADMTFQQVRGTVESAFFFNPNQTLLAEDTNTNASKRGFVQPKISDASTSLIA